MIVLVKICVALFLSELESHLFICLSYIEEILSILQ